MSTLVISDGNIAGLNKPGKEAFSVSLSSPIDRRRVSFKSDFLPRLPLRKPNNIDRNYTNNRNNRSLSTSVAHSSVKIVRDRSLDRHVVKQNKIRFVQKLKTLLLSKPKHYMPIHILYKCRSYLSLSKPRSLLSMIHRYPSIFELFPIPTPPTPLNATKPYSQLCVRLTPAASALATQESILKSTMSITLAEKLQKLLMLSSDHRLLLSKLVHLGPDLGLPPSFRSKLCNDHPDKFKTVDTSHGRALELVSLDLQLTNQLPSPEVNSELIVDRPMRFKHLRLRKGLNLKRSHRDFLIKFGELPYVCPYKTPIEELAKESIEAEKRACAVIREVLGMMVEKRTLVDHLTHFRKEFGLPNKLRGLLVRHPELFYVSLKGQRDSVFLLEGYDDKGALLEKDEILLIKEKLMELVREGKQMRRERRNSIDCNDLNYEVHDDDENDGWDAVYDDGEDDYDDDLDNLFEPVDSGTDDEGNGGDCDAASHDLMTLERKKNEFWRAEPAHVVKRGGSRDWQSW